MTLYDLVLQLNMLLAALGALLAMLRSEVVPGRRSYATMAGAGALWCAGELLVTQGGLETWTGVRLIFLAEVLVGPMWLGVAAHLSRISLARRIPWFPAALLVPGLLIWGLLFLEPWSALVLRAPRSPGVLYWIFSAYTYAMIVAGAVIHARAGMHADTARVRWQRYAIASAGLVPLAAHASFAASGFAWPRDPTPVALLPVGAALAAALFPGGLLDVRPVVQQELIERLPLGVVLADRSGTVIDLNPHALGALDLSADEALGRTLEAVLAEVEPGYRIECSDVWRAGRRIARFAFLHPPVEDVRSEAA